MILAPWGSHGVTVSDTNLEPPASPTQWPFRADMNRTYLHSREEEMPLRHEALPFRTTLDTQVMSRPRLLAASGIALVLSLALLPGLASPSLAAAARPAAQVPAAAAPPLTLTTTGKACERKKRRAVRKISR